MRTHTGRTALYTGRTIVRLRAKTSTNAGSRVWTRFQQDEMRRMNLKAIRAMLERMGPPPAPEPMKVSLATLAWFQNLEPQARRSQPKPRARRSNLTVSNKEEHSKGTYAGSATHRGGEIVAWRDVALSRFEVRRKDNGMTVYFCRFLRVFLSLPARRANTHCRLSFCRLWGRPICNHKNSFLGLLC